MMVEGVKKLSFYGPGDLVFKKKEKNISLYTALKPCLLIGLKHEIRSRCKNAALILHKKR